MNEEATHTTYPEERRLVTVMFADVQGFTSLAEQLDFETISDVLKEIWLKLDRIIEAHGGYIDKHMGDGVLAIWGAPYGNENDADNAISAGLELLAAVEDYTQHTKETAVRELKMRVGIHSGQVFAGYVGLKNEYTILGDTVNIASRLEQYAEPGTIIISDSTYKLTRIRYNVSRPDPVMLKGKQEPVMTYLIDGAQLAASKGNYKGSESMETHLVGRQSEMNQLASLLKESQNTQFPTMVIVSADTGMGKSRLMMEFSRRMEEANPRVRVLTARALSQARNVPYYLWKMIWQNHFGLRDNDTNRVNNEKFLQEVQKLWGDHGSPNEAIEAAHVIGHLVGMDWSNSVFLAALNTPQARMERAYALTRELLSHMCAACPTAIVIDDLHAVDTNSLDLLQSLLKPADASALPLFIMAGSRPEFLIKQPEWNNYAHIMHLNPLPANASLVLEAYPDLKNYPAPVLEALARQAEGNPYFLEEMVKILIKSNTSSEPASQDVVDHLRTSPPESLQAALQARLDLLPRTTRSVALMAALVGRVFWVGAVISAMRMASKFGTGSLSLQDYSETERVVREALLQLEQAELVFPKAGYDFSNEQEYIFKSSLLRDVAYNLILMRYRPFYHKAVADWLANHPELDFKFMAAEHYELAGWPAHAARQYEQAARYTMLRGAGEEAEKLLARAAGLRDQAKSQKTIPLGG